MPFSAQEKRLRGGLSPDLAEEGGNGSSLPSWEWEAGVREGLRQEAEFGLDLEEESGCRKVGREGGGEFQIQKHCILLSSWLLCNN